MTVFQTKFLFWLTVHCVKKQQIRILQSRKVVTDQVIYSSVLYTISHENLVSIYLLNALT